MHRSLRLPRLAMALVVVGGALVMATAPAATAWAAPSFAAEKTPTPAKTDSPNPADKNPERLQTFGIGPSNAEGIDKRPAFVYFGGPGTVIKDKFVLLNYTTKPVKVNVYPSDGFTTENGGFDVRPAAEKSTDLGSWTNLRPRVVTIPARSKSPASPPAQVIVPFTLKVPKGAGPGDHAGGIVASTSSKPIQGNVSGVVVDRRVGTRIYLRVPGDLQPRLEIKDLSATYDQTINPVGTGEVRVTYRIANTGNVALSAAQRVRIEGLLGSQVDSTPIDDAVQILPGSDVVVSAEVSGVWPTFRGKAVVDLDPYSGTEDAKEPFPTVTASTGFWMIPWTLLATILLIIASAWVYRRWRARRISAPVGVDPELPELVNA